MRNKINQQMLLLAVAGSVSAGAWALDPAYIPVTDGVVFTPTLKVTESYDNNLYAQRDDRKSSWVTTLAPTFRLNADGHKSSYQLQYTAERDIFHSSSRDNNTDHFLNADAGYRFNERNQLMLDAGYRRVTDIGASSLLDGRRLNSYEKYSIKNIGGNYIFGADAARMQLDLALGYEELRFHGRSYDYSRDRERDTTDLRSTFYYRVAPKTRLVVEGLYADYDYVKDARRDSTNTGLMAGFVWDTTSRTTGYVKAGREWKKFKNSYSSGKGFKDNSADKWEAGVVWSPHTYSIFELSTRRGIVEAEDDASNIRLQSYGLDWTRYWREHLYSNIELAHHKYSYQKESTGISSRTDKMKSHGFSVTYEMRRWLDISLGYTRYHQSSNRDDGRYKREVYALTFHGSL